MFGLVTASLEELNDAQQARYRAVYCGICRSIMEEGSSLCRLGLSYDMAFLALLLNSLYEPEELSGTSPCPPHPIHRRAWSSTPYVRYAAQMNIALAYYNALDDWQDDHRLSAKLQANLFGRTYPAIRAKYPRQCAAIEDCIQQLSDLEKQVCPNPDIPANCFGRLMGELLVFHEDLWAVPLRQMGHALGRFIYLADAAVDYRKDRRRKKYNPFLAMGMDEDFQRWEDYLVLAIAACTDCYERLPLVQDKALLDNILYSGVWINYRNRQRKSQEEQENG